MAKIDFNTPVGYQPANAQRLGDGAPVLCIHGLAASLYDWKDLLPALAARGYGAHALDLLGHGGSYKPARYGDYSAAAVYEHMAAWIDSLRLDRPAVFVGHSLGGYLAVEHALRHPDRVRALVLVDPFYVVRQMPFFLRAGFRGPLITSELIEFTPRWLVRLLVDLTSLSIRNGYMLPGDVRAQTADDYKRAAPGIFNIPHTIRDQTPDLHRVHAPTLVVWGESDGTLSPASFREMVARLPNARPAVLRAGHVPHQSNAEEFNRIVLEFLENT